MSFGITKNDCILDSLELPFTICVFWSSDIHLTLITGKYFVDLTGFVGHHNLACRQKTEIYFSFLKCCFQWWQSTEFRVRHLNLSAYRNINQLRNQKYLMKTCDFTVSEYIPSIFYEFFFKNYTRCDLFQTKCEVKK